MKKLIIFILFSLTATLAFAEEKPITFAIGEWNPYTGEKLKNYGLATEIVSAACDSVGIKYKYTFYPWKRAENNVQDGVDFATFPFKRTSERIVKFNFSDTLFNSSYGILILKDHKKTAGFKFTEPKDLAGFKVGIVAGTDPIKLPVEKAGGVIEEVQNSEQNINKLESERIDFYIDDAAVIYQTLNRIYNETQAKKFTMLDKRFGDENEFQLMVSKTYPKSNEILSKFNEGLKKIKENGEYSKILKQYGLKK